MLSIKTDSHNFYSLCLRQAKSEDKKINSTEKHRRLKKRKKSTLILTRIEQLARMLMITIKSDNQRNTDVIFEHSNNNQRLNIKYVQ